MRKELIVLLGFSVSLSIATCSEITIQVNKKEGEVLKMFQLRK